jgi:hypothetical protein
VWTIAIWPPTCLPRCSQGVFSHLVLSRTCSKFYRSDQHGLSSLFSLRTGALNSMPSLCVCLNTCSCTPDHQCPEQDEDEICKQYNSCHPNCRPGRDMPISRSQLDGQMIKSEWKMITRRLADHINPSQLKLSIVCDTLDDTTAMSIAEPLLELPTLIGCAICLGQAPDAAYIIWQNRLCFKPLVTQATTWTNHFDFLTLQKRSSC